MNSIYIQAIFAASIGGILYGYDMGVISGALPSLGAYFQMTSTQQEWVVSALYFGGGFGAATGGIVCDMFGRKRSILVCDLVFGIGAFLLYSAQTVSTIMIGRVVVGWAVAVSAIADVAYLHEISSAWEGEGTINHSGPQIQNGANHVAPNRSSRRLVNIEKSSSSGRGSVVSINEACISLGFLIAYGVAYSMGTSDNLEEWRPMFGFGGVLAIVQFLGMLIMPESPVWLRSQGRISEANNSMNKIRGTTLQPSPSSVEVEMHTTTPPPTSQTPAIGPDEFRLSGTSENANYAVSIIIHLRSILHNFKQNYKRIAKKMFIPYKRQWIVSIFLASSQQFCGHPNVLNYSAEIFSILNGVALDSNIDISMEAGEQNTELTSVELTVGIGIFKFLTTIAVILFVERVGRRPLLISGMIVILVSLSLLMLAFSGHDAVDIQQQQEEDSVSTSSFRGTLGVIGIYGVAVGYASSYGPLSWLIISEMFPSSIRGRALGFATVVTYIAAGIVSRTFLSLQNEIGLSKSFSLYGLATFMSILFVCVAIPETGSLTVEEINEEFDKKLIWGGSRATVNGSSWASLRSYGSDIDGISPTPSSETIVAETIVKETEPSGLGLSPRRSSSRLVV